MAGYIGSKIAVTQVDGYNRTEADAEFVQVTGDTMTGALTVNSGGSFTMAGGGLKVFNNGTSGFNANIFFGIPNQTDGWSIGQGITANDGVFRIYDNGAGQARMAVDASGRVTMPYQPSFYSVLSSDWTYTGGGNRVIVPFNDVRFNVGGNFNTGTGKFTAPVSGKYLFTARLSTNSVATGDYFSVDFMKNDSAYSLGWNGDDGSNYRFVAASVVMDMAANDTAHVATEIANSTTIKGSSVRSFFAGYLLG